MSQPAGTPLPACCYAFATDVLRLGSNFHPRGKAVPVQVQYIGNTNGSKHR